MAKPTGRPTGRPPNTVEDFWEKVDKNGPNGCWLWCGTIDMYGYGRFSIRRKQNKAHRFAYELVVGPISEGLVIDHLCKVRHCVNPDHLDAVTSRENAVRGEYRMTGLRVRARKPHCPQGHPYTEENTRHHVTPQGSNGRRCWICIRQQGKARRLAQRRDESR